MSGTPMAPKATGAVLAMSAMPAPHSGDIYMLAIRRAKGHVAAIVGS